MKTYKLCSFLTISALSTGLAQVGYSADVSLRAISGSEMAPLLGKVKTLFEPKAAKRSSGESWVDIIKNQSFEILVSGKEPVDLIPVYYATGDAYAGVCALAFVSKKFPDGYSLDVVGSEGGEYEAVQCGTAEPAVGIADSPAGSYPRIAFVFTGSTAHEGSKAPVVVFYDETSGRYKVEDKLTAKLDQGAVDSIAKIRKFLKKDK